MSDTVINGCPSGWKYNPSNHKCYRYFSSAMTWTDARNNCRRYGGGELASVPDSGTNSFITSLTTSLAWIGGYRKYSGQNVWGWTDGSRWTYSRWYSGEPNNAGGAQNVIVINFIKTGYWDDTTNSATNKNPFVCQISA